MKRDGFTSKVGTLMALIGSAVGLGNFWKFPYMTGKNGGAAFILTYIVFLIMLCLPLMLSEFVIGRRSQANVFGAFRKLAPGSKWPLTGAISVLTVFVILSFYSVIGGLCFEYLIDSIINKSQSLNAATRFAEFISSPVKPILVHLLFLGATVAILWTGIKTGIEKYSKILMPALFILVIVLAVYALTLPGAGKGVEFLLKPDFGSLTSGAILDALGQGLFSLSLGMGIVITYGSYTNRRENLSRMTIITIVMDLVFALLAGFVILPAVFAFGFQPDQGPGLIFVVLPEVFARMPFGTIFAVAFFIALTIAALTSAVSLLEVAIAYMTEDRKLSRKKSLLISGSILACTGTLCSLSFGLLSGFKIFGNTIFDLFDNLSTTVLMPLCAFLISIFTGWKMKYEDVYDELSSGKLFRVRLFNVFIFTVRYIVPPAIIIIFLNNAGLF